MSTFGINASQLVNMIKYTKSEGKDIMKIVFSINGSPCNPIDCKSVNISMDAETMTVNCETDGSEIDPENLTRKEIAMYEPSSKGILAQNDAEIYYLTGKDLEDYNALSKFSKKELQSEQTTGATSVTLETDFYDILELDSVNHAVQDLIAQETLYLSKGAKIVKNEVPRYVYSEDGEENRFKLVKVALVID